MNASASRVVVGFPSRYALGRTQSVDHPNFRPHCGRMKNKGRQAQGPTSFHATNLLVALDRLEIQRAGLTLVVGAALIAEALTDSGSNILVPQNRALLEAEIVAAGFLLDF